MVKFASVAYAVNSWNLLIVALATHTYHITWRFMTNPLEPNRNKINYPVLCKTQVTSLDIRVTSSDLQVASSTSQVPSSNIRVTSSNP